MRKLSWCICLISSNFPYTAWKDGKLTVQGVPVTARENVAGFSFFESDCCATTTKRQEKPFSHQDGNCPTPVPRSSCLTINIEAAETLPVCT